MVAALMADVDVSEMDEDSFVLPSAPCGDNDMCLASAFMCDRYKYVNAAEGVHMYRPDLCTRVQP